MGRSNTAFAQHRRKRTVVDTIGLTAVVAGLGIIDQIPVSRVEGGGVEKGGGKSPVRHCLQARNTNQHTCRAMSCHVMV